MIRPFYEHAAGGFKFHIFRRYLPRRKGWSARVRPYSSYHGGWPTVRDASGRYVVCLSKKSMCSYLDYAYAGKETTVRA